MMNNFEFNYVELIRDILQNGQRREGRNGVTKSVFGRTLTIDMSGDDRFPLLYGRKMFPGGIFGEFAALIRGPHHIDDFKVFDCNYWDTWADEQGYLNIDYGNLWSNFAGVDQMAKVKDKLKNNPADRRMIVTGWNPVGMEELSLPCCHLLYQWYVNDIDGVKHLDMIWYQRSVDTMIGLPSDIVLAALWNVLLANEVGMAPGKITMMLGDTHIYAEHSNDAIKYCNNVLFGKPVEYPKYTVESAKGTPIEEFLPNMITLTGYNPYPSISYRLKK